MRCCLCDFPLNMTLFYRVFLVESYLISSHTVICTISFCSLQFHLQLAWYMFFLSWCPRTSLVTSVLQVWFVFKLQKRGSHSYSCYLCCKIVWINVIRAIYVFMLSSDLSELCAYSHLHISSFWFESVRFVLDAWI